MSNQINMSTQESQKEDQMPSKEDMIKFYEDKLPLLRLQAEYIVLNRDIAVAKYEHVQAMLAMNEMQKQPDKEQK